MVGWGGWDGWRMFCGGRARVGKEGESERRLGGLGRSCGRFGSELGACELLRARLRSYEHVSFLTTTSHKLNFVSTPLSPTHEETNKPI